MKTISFLNNKGGVGKTATTGTVAHMLATLFNKKSASYRCRSSGESKQYVHGSENDGTACNIIKRCTKHDE